jgi:hypothetical protein
MRTNVASNEVVRPKSLVCCFSDGIGMCTQYASTDRIFMAVFDFRGLDWFRQLSWPSGNGPEPDRSPALSWGVILLVLLRHFYKMHEMGGCTARLAVFAVFCSDLSAIEISAPAKILRRRWFDDLK